jgi:hypothetical protein
MLALLACLWIGRGVQFFDERGEQFRQRLLDDVGEIVSQRRRNSSGDLGPLGDDRWNGVAIERRHRGRPRLEPAARQPAHAAMGVNALDTTLVSALPARGALGNGNPARFHRPCSNGFLQGARPFGIIEVIWAGVAVRRWRNKTLTATVV